jgi:hypothetical protein
MKNLFGKSRKFTDAYATYTGYGPFGETVMYVLKTYQNVESEAKN